MSKNNTVQDLSDLFVSPKTTTGIPAPHPAIREALIQVSLNPEVRSIDYIASAVVASEQVDLGAIIVQRNPALFLGRGARQTHPDPGGRGVGIARTRGV